MKASSKTAVTAVLTPKRSLILQASSIFLAVTISIAASVYQYVSSYVSEPPLYPELVSDTSSAIGTEVKVAMHITSFERFSFFENDFIFQALISFSFPVGTETLRALEQFSFRDGKIIHKSKPVVSLDGSMVTVRYYVTAKISTPLSFADFPVGDHRLLIVLENKSVTPTRLHFSPEEQGFRLETETISKIWKLKESYVEAGAAVAGAKLSSNKEEVDVVGIDKTGHLVSDGVSYPCVFFSTLFENRDIRRFIILYLPLLLIFLIVLTSLVPDVTNLSTRFPVIASGVPILALHSLVIDNMSPPNSGLTRVDAMYLALVIVSLGILVFQTVAAMLVKFVGGSKTIRRLRVLNGIVFVLSLVAMTGSMVKAALA